MKSISQKMTNYHFSPGFLKPYLNKFIDDLDKNGYTKLTMQSYYYSVSHFATWLQNKNIKLNEINDAIVADFSRHRCSCLGSCKRNKISCKYLKRVKRFILYLNDKNNIFSKRKTVNTVLSPTLVKFKESLQCRGLSPITVANYEYSMRSILPFLGKSSIKYNATIIRKVILDANKKNSISATKKLTTALRAYLRFLTIEGLCNPDLDKAVPTVAQWKLSSLPKYITEKELEQVIKSCDRRTHQGLRDRAIILLLSRLGLRGGDVTNIKISDINWQKSTLRISGKGRRETLLPLPQEVGDALISYIEKVRPSVSIEKLFLCLNAPYRPFSSSVGISNVVDLALSRAGIKNPPSRGAHLLRHTAATNMLRQGATLEAVSTVLRHRTLDMTGYYAKVDIPRLKKISQPWPEVCHVN